MICASFSPNASKLITGGSGYTLKLWTNVNDADWVEEVTPECFIEDGKKESKIQSVTFSRDANWVVVASSSNVHVFRTLGYGHTKSAANTVGFSKK